MTRTSVRQNNKPESQALHIVCIPLKNKGDPLGYNKPKPCSYERRQATVHKTVQ
jgi:hypothetical protein